ncbi:50S ribosomal protein L27 [Candidatus Vidania fulgoroideae]|uniref:Large ribosomal subunit protein bL27 n=1 Tax=Candidatus Vidania fulgoroideorum TaxID=881286 RepID=A0A974X7C2_9PROT|nr:50S ribosomal protein L27 [Candidatus Vidania fulgoroideae]
MAKKKAAGSVKNGRDSIGRRLGIKFGHGAYVTGGCIILRQRGAKFLSCVNTACGSDYSIYSLESGRVYFCGRYVSVLTG